MSALRSHGLRLKKGCSGRRGSNGPEDVRRSPRPNSTPNCSGRTNTADSSARRPGPVQYGSHIPARWPCHTSCTSPYGTSVLPFSLGVLVDLIGHSAAWLTVHSGAGAVPCPIAPVEVLRVVAQSVEQQRRHMAALADLAGDDDVARPQLAHPLTKLIDRYVDRPGQRPAY